MKRIINLFILVLALTLLTGCAILEPEWKAPFYGEQGEFYLSMGRYDQALSAFTREIELNPRIFVAYIGRGLAYEGKGMYDEAISDLNKIIGNNPEVNFLNARAYCGRGRAYAGKGMYDYAISDYNKVFGFDPKNCDAYIHRGFAYDKKGEHERAISDFNKAIELCNETLERDQPPVRTYYNVGIPTFKDTISERIERAILMVHASTYYNRGIAYFGKGEYDKAWDDVHKAQSLGFQVPAEFLKNLREASGRQE